MTANARRARRSTSAAADPEPTPEPASTLVDPAQREDPAAARRRSSSGRVVAFPEPTPNPGAALPPQFLAASPAPAVPPEEPAVLHPSDRRSFEPARPMFSSPLPVAELAIGEIDQTLFDCPACRRPLALGARRCPGCGTRLVRSVMLRKAALFVAVGLAIGGLAGLGGGIAIGSRLGAPGAAAGVLVAASQGPAASTPASTATAAAVSASAAPVATPSPAGGSMPSVVRGALVQALALDDRLGAAEAELRAAVAARTFDASGVAAILRTVSAESLFGEQLAPAVSAWPEGGDLGVSLATFYGTVHDTAVTALDNSVQNGAAYKAAARSMAALLAARAALDDAIRSAAAASGVSLPAATP